MNRVLWLLVILVLVLTSIIIFRSSKESYEVLPANLNQPPLPAKPFGDWTQYTSDVGKFSVMMPVIPQHASESVPDTITNGLRRYNMYVAEKHTGVIFMVSVITYPKDIDEVTEEIIKETVIKEMMRSNPTNTLKDEKTVNFLNRRTTNFEIENKDFHIHGLEFMAGRSLYLLTYIARQGQYDDAEYHHFVDSFRLKEDVPAPAQPPATTPPASK